MLSCNIGNYLIKRQSKRYIKMSVISVHQYHLSKNGYNLFPVKYIDAFKQIQHDISSGQIITKVCKNKSCFDKVLLMVLMTFY